MPSQKWIIPVHVNKPKVGIIITHYNYADFIDRAIQSALSQTYEEYEIVVVDDQSNEENRKRLSEILKHRKGQVKAVWREENQGQLEAFFAGVSEIEADFYCMLDPDDEYLPTFIEDMVALHLNKNMYVAMVCSNQICTVNGRQLTGTKLNNNVKNFTLDNDQNYNVKYFNWQDGRWPWTSTSSMMFRKDALKLLKSTHKTDVKICADTYLAAGCRYMGGTLIYEKPLVLRSIHQDSAFQTDYLISNNLKSERFNAKEMQRHLRQLAFLNIIENGGDKLFGKKLLKKIARNEFPARGLIRIRNKSSKAKKLISLLDLFWTLFRGLKRNFIFRKHKS